MPSESSPESSNAKIVAQWRQDFAVLPRHLRHLVHYG